MAFVWDPIKAAVNIRDHHVRFEDAEYVFEDPLRMIRRDDDHSTGEERFQTIGMYHDLLFVVYAEEDAEDTRIISARLAEPFERRIYYGAGKAHSQGWFRVNP
jgi:uncharacterized DUF497 family protein